MIKYICSTSAYLKSGLFALAGLFLACTNPIEDSAASENDDALDSTSGDSVASENDDALDSTSGDTDFGPSPGEAPFEGRFLWAVQAGNNIYEYTSEDDPEQFIWPNDIAVLSNSDVVVVGEVHAATFGLGEETETVFESPDLEKAGFIARYGRDGDFREVLTAVGGQFNSVTPLKNGGFVASGYFMREIVIPESVGPYVSDVCELPIEEQNGECELSTFACFFSEQGELDQCHKFESLFWNAQSITTANGNVILWSQEMVALDETGEVLWRKGDIAIWMKFLTPAPDGGFFAAGSFDEPIILGEGEAEETLLEPFAGIRTCFLARYDDAGRLIWAHRVSAADFDGRTIEIQGITAAKDGTLRVAGNLLYGTSDNLSAAAYDADGAILWARNFAEGDFLELTAMQGFSDGSFIVAGEAWPATFGSGTAVEAEMPKQFVARLASDGEPLWVVPAGGDFTYSGDDTVIATAPGGETLISNLFHGDAVFGDVEPTPTLSSFDWLDMFVAKIGK